VGDPWQQHVDALGEFIRAQRQLAKLSLRDLAERARVSNPYLSQIERGMHAPSVRVLTSIATALGLSPETLLAEAGMATESDVPASTTEAVIRSDASLTDEQKEALLAVYRSYVAANERT
jgi:transcriptional regulator with XRE-family HTH domain